MYVKSKTGLKVKSQGHGQCLKITDDQYIEETLPEKICPGKKKYFEYTFEVY